MPSAIACLRSHMTREGLSGDVWVVDLKDPGTLIREAEAVIVADSATRPPMGMLYAVAR